MCRVVTGSEEENELTERLFKDDGYNPLIRPVKNTSDVIRVNVTLYIVQILLVVGYCIFYQKMLQSRFYK